MKGRESHKERVHAAKEGVKHEEHKKRAAGGRMLHEDKHDGKERGHEKVEVTKKDGGKVEHHKRKRGGPVEGKHPEHRLDKRARGGAMTPKSPYSGADAPNLKYAHGDLAVDAHGKGKDRD